MRLQRFVSFLLASALATAGFAQTVSTQDIAARRMELMQEKQLAMQELQLVLMKAQNLQQEDISAQQQQRHLANQTTSGSVTAQLLAIQQREELMRTRQRIAQESRENKQREEELKSQLRDIDSQLKPFK